MANKLNDEDLTSKLKSPGWRLTVDHPDKGITGTLGEVVKVIRAKSGASIRAGFSRS